MSAPTLTRSGQKKISSGHPWLLATDLNSRTSLPERPSAVFFAEHWWLCSPESFLRLRRLGPMLPNWMRLKSISAMTNADQFRQHFAPWLGKHFTELLIQKKEKLNL